MSQIQRPHQYNPELIHQENSRLGGETKVVDMASELGLNEVDSGDVVSPTANPTLKADNSMSENMVSLADYSLANEARLRAELQCRKAEERAEQLIAAYKTTQSIIAYRSRSQIEALKAEVAGLKKIVEDDRNVVASLQARLSAYEAGKDGSVCNVNFNSLHDMSLKVAEYEAKIAELEQTNSSSKFEIMEYRNIAEEAQKKLLENETLGTKDIDTLVQLQVALDRLVLEQQVKKTATEDHTPMAITLMSEVKTLRKQKADSDNLINDLRIQLATGSTTSTSASDHDDDKAKLLEKLAKSEATVNSLTQELNSLAQTFTQSTGDSNKITGEIVNLQRSLAQKEAIIKRHEESIAERDTVLRELKENAKNVLKDASEQIKKLKEENAKLRDEIIKIKQSSSNEIKKLHEKLIQSRTVSAHQRKLELQKVKNELMLIKQDTQSLRNNIVQNNTDGGMSNIANVIVNEVQRRMGIQQELINDLRDNYERELRLRKKVFNQLQELKGNIRVYARVRPLLERERTEKAGVVSIPREGEIRVRNEEKKQVHTFEFEKVFDEQSTQTEVFNEVQDLVISVLDGFNVCIFAYGQTGSGKTFTMEGYPGNPGVNIRALEKLFNEIEEKSSQWNYTMRLTLLEIYNEKVQDLLGEQENTLKVVQGKDGMEVLGLTQVNVETADDVQRWLAKGKKNRHVTKTDMNEHSSRSHLILSVYTHGVNKHTGVVATGKLHLIDLAGSERISRSGVTGEALKEAQKINYSLSALGNVISARANKKEHVPYRDSMLTYLLQDSLEKNSKTLMFVQLSQTAESMTETLCSLRFAERVRKVELGKAEKKVSAASREVPEDDD